MSKVDRIYLWRGSYDRHGIDCANATLIEYQETQEASGTVRRIARTMFNGHLKINNNKYDRCDSTEIEMVRATNPLGEDKYCVFIKNCEHFATCFETAQYKSKAVNKAFRNIGDSVLRVMGGGVVASAIGGGREIALGVAAPPVVAIGAAVAT
ncbi:lecithin retinol acyltransferase family protein [Oxynema sp. CENA135]|uniref:lecithin retinol acyltransferase family protein n=1 Tax=Oxynema sp. CENA135 TaxID=984206 RepID=UPI00190AE3C3|nr:lecithin retinol acyltransferase family protein [Oxynema sp. CENA135]MBK4731934.1 lecithin retinol acyltransferase family protein [Oxynema sp. CENA135]